MQLSEWYTLKYTGFGDTRSMYVNMCVNCLYVLFLISIQ